MHPVKLEVGQSRMLIAHAMLTYDFSIFPFPGGVWFDGNDRLTSWDTGHIYPQNPGDRKTQNGTLQLKNMSSWLDHLGNLTRLPIRDNFDMQNTTFAGEESKLDWFQSQRKVSCNARLSHVEYRGKLTDRPHWGANNCKKPVDQIRKTAAELWGWIATAKPGTGPVDAGYRDDLTDDLDKVNVATNTEYP